MSFFQAHDAHSRRQVRHVIIAGLALVLAALAPHRATAAEVALMTSGKPAPASITIAVGGQVNWRNFAASPRSVVAAQNAFPAFTVSAQGSHAQPFLKMGNYPYQVDKQFNGVVTVAAQRGGQQAIPDILTASDNCRDPLILHYDVSVYGYRRSRAHLNADLSKGDVTQTAEWSAEWPDVKIGAVKCMSLLQSQVHLSNAPNLDASETATGHLVGSFDYSNTAPPLPHIDDSLPCHFHVALSASETLELMHSSVAQPPPGKTSFDLDTKPADEKNPVRAQIDAANPSCKRNRVFADNQEEWNGNHKTTPVNGVNFSIGDYLVHLYVGQLQYLAFPEKELVQGKGFRIDSGEQTIDETTNRSEPHIVTDHVIVTFTPKLN